MKSNKKPDLFQIKMENHEGDFEVSRNQVNQLTKTN